MLGTIISILIAPVLLAVRKVRYSSILNKARVISLRALGARVGRDVKIRPEVIIKGIKNINIGDNVYIGEGTIIVGNGGTVTIGNDVMIAEHVYISTQNHRFRNPLRTMKSQGYKNAPVLIHNDVWLAHSAIVLAGTVIGKGSVIAANVVSPKQVAENSIVSSPSPTVLNRDKHE